MEQIYRSHGHIVLRRARNLLGSEADAQEILQEIFASLIERPEQFQGNSSITTFLYSATTHMCLNRIRDQRTRQRLLEARGRVESERLAPRGEAAAVLRDVLRRLPEELCAATVYYHLDEMTHEEIARVMGCSRRHVGDLLQRAAAWVVASEEAP